MKVQFFNIGKADKFFLLLPKWYVSLYEFIGEEISQVGSAETYAELMHHCGISVDIEVILSPNNLLFICVL